MSTYSFLNVVATITGPGAIALNLASGAAVAEEGLTIEAAEDKNVMTIGADGKGQHSLVANNACLITVRLLKTSPVNFQLMLMYNLQSASAALWGVNIFTLQDTGRGDLVIAQLAAFKKKPTLTYAKEAGLNEWTFDAITSTEVLGAG